LSITQILGEKAIFQGALQSSVVSRNTPRGRLVALAALFLLVCTETASYSKEIGEKLNLTPTFVVQEIYDSNVFKVRDKNRVQTIFNDSQMDDFMTFYSAGLQLEYPTNNQKFIIGGNKNFVRYAHYQQQNYENESLRGRAELKLGDGFFITPAYTYSKSVVSRSNNQNRQKNDFLTRNQGGINGGYQASRWKVSAFLRKADSGYRLSTGLDRKTESYGGTFTLIPSSSSQWHLRLSRRELKFASTGLTNDNQTQDILLGGSFIFTGRNQLEIEGGRRRKIFSSGRREDFNGFIGNLSLSHQITRDSALSLRFSRNTDTSYFTNTTYYVSNTINAGLSCQLTSKISGSLSASQGWTDYKGTSGANAFTQQRYLTLGFGLNYLFHENINCGLSYEFQRRTTNQDAWEFKAHQVVAQVSLSWK